MSFTSKKVFQRGVSILLIGKLFVACSAGTFSKAELADRAPQSLRYATATAHIITPPSNSVDANLKILFCVDTSLSNHGDATNPGTDPTGSRRWGSITQFVNNISTTLTSGAEKVYWGLITFSDGPIEVQNFTNDSNAFKGVIDNQRMNLHDGGNTNYVLTLTKAQEMITNDITANNLPSNPNPNSTRYVIVFLTDGRPYVNGQIQQTSTVLTAISSLMVLSSQPHVLSVTVNPGLYYSATTDPAQVLAARDVGQAMALTGNGNFVDLGNSGAFNLDAFGLPIIHTKYLLKDVIASNMNAVWYNGQLVQDSDADGVPDGIEIQERSNPNNSDSDGDGISDGMQRILFGKSCKTPDCSQVTVTQHPECNGMLIPAPPGSPIRYALSPDKGMNQCEMKILHLSSQTWSFADLVPISLRKMFGLSLNENSFQDSALDPNANGISNYDEIKVHSDPYSKQNKGGIPPYKYELKQISSSALEDEYELTIGQIAVLGEKDTFRIYIVESTPIDENNHVRIGEKSFQEGSVTFSNTDFPME